MELRARSEGQHPLINLASELAGLQQGDISALISFTRSLHGNLVRELERIARHPNGPFASTGLTPAQFAKRFVAMSESERATTIQAYRCITVREILNGRTANRSVKVFLDACDRSGLWPSAPAKGDSSATPGFSVFSAQAKPDSVRFECRTVAFMVSDTDPVYPIVARLAKESFSLRIVREPTTGRILLVFSKDGKELGAIEMSDARMERRMLVHPPALRANRS